MAAQLFASFPSNTSVFEKRLDVVLPADQDNGPQISVDGVASLTASGALPLVNVYTIESLDTTGAAVDLTLADGETPGQTIAVVIEAAAGTNQFSISPDTSPIGPFTIADPSASGQGSITLVWASGAWYLLGTTYQADLGVTI